MNASRFSVLALATFLAAPSFFLSVSANAQDLCAEDGAMMQAARAEQARAAAEAEKHAIDVYGPMAKSPEWLSDAQSLLANCVADQYSDWKVSSGSALFDQIANKAKDQAIDRACAEQRNRVAEYTSQATGYLSRIEGFQNIGSQGINFPDATGGIDYNDLIGNIGGGGQTPQIPQIPGVRPPTGGGIPGVSPPVQQPPGSGLPGIVP